MFFLLSHLTGLRIHPDVEDDDEEENEDDSDSEEEEEVELGDEEIEGEEEEEQKEKEKGKVDDDDPPIKKRRSNTPTFPADMYDENSDETIEKPNDTFAASSNCHADNFDDPVSTPSCRMELRRWQRACYSLLGDMSSSPSSSVPASLRQLLSSSELDVWLTVFPDDVAADKWDSRLHGGATIYVAKNEEEELLNIAPKHNSLSLVFKEKDTAPFVKYVNSCAPGQFFQIACGYQEVEVVEGEDQEEEEEVKSDGDEEKSRVELGNEFEDDGEDA